MKKNIIFIFAMLFVSLSVCGQQSQKELSIKLSNKAIDLSLLYFSNNDSITKALKLLDEAIALDEHNVFAHGRKIEILRQNNRFDETLKAADEAIRCNPQSQYYGFYLLKGVTLEKIGRKEEAEVVYKKGLELSESRLKENPTVGTFVDSYFLRYSVYRTDIPNFEIIAAIPSSFTKEERERVVGFMEMVGSIKEFQNNFVGNNGRTVKTVKAAPLPVQREDGVYNEVDEVAVFPGERGAMKRFVSEHFKKPAGCKSGIILVGLVVDADGNIRDAKIVRGIGEQADKEALRVVALMPKWEPAKVDGKAVPMALNIPITIQ